MNIATRRLAALLAALGSAAMLGACAGHGGALPQLAALPAADTAAADYALGRLRQRQGQFDAAIQAYQRSIAARPRQLDARNALATLYAQQARLADAQALLTALCGDFPDQAQPLSNLGYVNYLRGDYLAARAALRQALALDANQPHARANLALAERALRDGIAATPPARPTPTTSAPVLTPAATHPSDTLHGAAAAVLQPLPAALEVVQLGAHEFRLQTRAPLAASDAGADRRVPALAAPAGLAAPASETDSAAQAPLQIINGTMQSRLASHVKAALQRYGLASGRVLEQRRHYQRRTVIEYLPGHEQQARAACAALHGRALLLSARQLPDHAGVRLVLGSDLIDHIAVIDADAGQPLARLQEPVNPVSNAPAYRFATPYFNQE